MEKFRQGKCPLCGKMQSIRNTKKMVKCIYCTSKFNAEDAVKNYQNYLERINSNSMVYAPPEMMLRENRRNNEKLNITAVYASPDIRNRQKRRSGNETKPYPYNFTQTSVGSGTHQKEGPKSFWKTIKAKLLGILGGIFLNCL